MASKGKQRVDEGSLIVTRGVNECATYKVRVKLRVTCIQP